MQARSRSSHFLPTFGDGKLGGKFALRSLLSAPEQIVASASEVAYDEADYAYVGRTDG